MSKNRLRVKPSRKPAMTVHRQATNGSKLVYLICTPRARKYKNGRRSRVIYIGTTGAGVKRMASSMADKAGKFLEDRGVRQLDVYSVTCPGRQGIRSWLSLERDLLIVFKSEYGAVPVANGTGHGFAPYKYSGLFQWSRLKKVLEMYEKNG